MRGPGFGRAFRVPGTVPGVETRREVLRRRYLNLGIGELVAAAVFAVVAAVFVAPRLPGTDDVRALWAALVPLLVVLVQAGVYWLGARAWVHHAVMPRPLALVYRLFRVVDVALLAAGLIGVVVWWPTGVGAALLVAAVWGFGVIEYVNYFVVRLAYPVGRWFTSVGQWRTPQLMRDVRASTPTGRRSATP